MIGSHACIAICVSCPTDIDCGADSAYICEMNWCTCACLSADMRNRTAGARPSSPAHTRGCGTQFCRLFWEAVQHMHCRPYMMA